MTKSNLPLLDRRQVVKRLLRDRGDALAVASLGNPTFDLASVGDHAQNFYLWGAMGGAVMLGLGLAQAQPERRVIVFVGDGEMMMGLGSLGTVAAHGAANLSIVVIDNEYYAETGMQPSHAGRGVDIAGVAAACGFSTAVLVRTEEELEKSVDAVMNGAGPVLITVKVDNGPQPVALPPRDGPYLRSRFREALLGSDAHV